MELSSSQSSLVTPRKPSVFGNTEVFAHSAASLAWSTATWSFPQSKRFSQSLPETVRVFFTPQMTSLGYRSTGFGYGNRLKTKVSDSPSPFAYDPKVNFNSNRYTTIGKAPGDTAFLKAAYLATKDVPGPGTYQTHKVESKIGFSLKSRQELGNPHAQYPGPGTYSPLGKLTMRSKCAGGLFSGGKRVAFTTKESLGVPGPGSYEVSSSLSKRPFISK